MAREAKIGIVVIGILLVVFSGLLIKRLSRHTKVPMASAPVNKPSDATARQAAKPAPPTMVTPKPEMGKPPELMASDNASSATADSSQWNARSRRETPSNSHSDDAVSSRNRASTSLMATAGDRYRSIADVPPASGSTAQLHRSGYASAEKEDAPIAPSPRPAYADVGTSDARDTSTSSSVNSGANSAQGTRYNLGTPTASSGFSRDPSPASPVGTRYPSPAPKAVDLSRPMTAPSTPDPFNPGSTPSYTPTSTYSATPSAQPTVTPPPVERRPSASPNASMGFDRVRSPATVATPISNSYGSNPYAPSYPPTAPVAMPSPPAVSGSAVNREAETYTVQPNDSFWTICEKLYGNGAYFKALYEHNRKRFKRRDELTVGQTISAPDEAVLRRTYPDLCPKPRAPVASTQQRLASASTRLNGGGRVYTVVEGDTLFEIARYELGKPSRWGEIYDLNRDILGSDFDYLRPGTELILPDDSGKRDTITRQPSEFLNRR